MAHCESGTLTNNRQLKGLCDSLSISLFFSYTQSLLTKAIMEEGKGPYQMKHRKQERKSHMKIVEINDDIYLISG